MTVEEILKAWHAGELPSAEAMNEIYREGLFVEAFLRAVDAAYSDKPNDSNDQITKGQTDE